MDEVWVRTEEGEVRKMEEKKYLVEQFVERWQKRADEIKQNPMPDNETKKILQEHFDEFRSLAPDYVSYVFDSSSDEKKIKRVEEYMLRAKSARSELVAAIAISNSKWRDKHPTIGDAIKNAIGKIETKITTSLFGKPL